MRTTNTLLKYILCLVFGAFMLFGGLANAAEDDGADSAEWVYDFEFYGWMPNLYITTASQDDITITLGDIISNLKWMTMFDVGAQKGKWSMNADFIYMHIGDHVQKTTGGVIGDPRPIEVGVTMKSFISTLIGGYEITSNDVSQLDFIAGARYLKIKLPLSVVTPSRSTRVEAGGHVWDGIVGLQGKTRLNEKWYMDYYGDIGTGNSELTWQTRVGFGYKFNKFTGTMGLRYLRWNFDDDAKLDNLRVLGPYVGAKWTW